MTGIARRLQQDLEIPVIDGVTAAVRLAESIVSLGLYTSKHGDYDYPPKKEFIGVFEHFSVLNINHLMNHKIKSFMKIADTKDN